RLVCRCAANLTRAPIRRGSRSATPRWTPSTSRAMHSTRNGTIRSRPDCRREAVIFGRRLNCPKRLSANKFWLAEFASVIGDTAAAPSGRSRHRFEHGLAHQRWVAVEQRHEAEHRRVRPVAPLLPVLQRAHIHAEGGGERLLRQLV